MILDYESQRKAFLAIAKQKGLRQTEVKVYLALLKVWKEAGWTESFAISNWYLYLRIAPRLCSTTIVHARQSLAEKGFFRLETSFPKGTCDTRSRYHFFPLYCPAMC